MILLRREHSRDRKVYVSYYWRWSGEKKYGDCTLGNVHRLCGRCKEYLARVDIFLFPTHHYEGVSMAIRERGVWYPVLATDIGGCREIITNGYNGFLYKQGDVEAMARDIPRARSEP